MSRVNPTEFGLATGESGTAYPPAVAQGFSESKKKLEQRSTGSCFSPKQTGQRILAALSGASPRGPKIGPEEGLHHDSQRGGPAQPLAQYSIFLSRARIKPYRNLCVLPSWDFIL